MWLESLFVSDFRNLAKQEILFDKKVNLFIGDNAQGKTNIIEAVYLLATSKSFRANKDVELIRWGKQSSIVEGRFGPNEIKVVIREGGKKAFINKQVKEKA